MKLTAIIAEYNPLHNGHIHHINLSKKLTSADGIIVIMSGNFVQRGTPAIYNKWIRTQMALLCGADLVIELPSAYAIASAEHFSFGAISIIHGLYKVQDIVFGSETDDIHKLDKIANFLYQLEYNQKNIDIQQLSKYQDMMKYFLNTGMSYPKARSNALNKVLHIETDFLYKNSSNDILGIEYIKSIRRLNSHIKTYSIKRQGSNYHSTAIKNEVQHFSSANAIRKQLLSTIDDDNFYKIKDSIPAALHDIYQNTVVTSEQSLYPYILYKLWSEDVNSLKNISEISEGLENRIIQSSIHSTDYNDLIDKIKTKRYTRTRIQRALLNIVLNLKKEDIHEIYKTNQHIYARILGANQKGRHIIKYLKNYSNIPIITNINKFIPYSNYMQQLIEFDHRTNDLYTLLSNNPSKGENQKHPPILMN